jgi:hypothetical protein
MGPGSASVIAGLPAGRADVPDCAGQMGVDKIRLMTAVQIKRERTMGVFPVLHGPVDN